MSQRTTAENVKGVLVTGKQYDGVTDLQPFIDTAVRVTDRVATLDTGSVLSTSDLEMIERYLAAHFYGHAEQMRSSRSVDGASASYQGQTGMYLEATHYGMSAMMLDFTGALRKINGGNQQATMTWLGKPPSEQTDYVDRD